MPKSEKSQYPLVSIVILTYNAKKYIKKCLESVLSQTYPTIEIIVVDNNSSDTTIKIISSIVIARSEATKQSRVFYDKDGVAAPRRNGVRNDSIKIIQNKINAGFAAGQNQGIRESKGKYILCLNQDAWLGENYIKNAVEIMESDEKIAAIQGKLIRYDFQNDKITGKIDTTGLLMLKNRRIINRDQGTAIKDLKRDKTEEIFGSDGAAPVYRREALEDVSLPTSYGFKNNNYKLTEYFDEDFWMYKEDVDLAWRLRLAGWKSFYAPMCIAYHGRGAGDSAAENYIDILKERRKISGMSKLFSWKNQRLMQIKNESLGLFIRHLPHILFKEAASWIYVLIFEEPYAIKSIEKFFSQIPSAYKKRKIIMSKKRVSDKEMKKWFE